MKRWNLSQIGMIQVKQNSLWFVRDADTHIWFRWNGPGAVTDLADWDARASLARLSVVLPQGARGCLHGSLRHWPHRAVFDCGLRNRRAVAEPACTPVLLPGCASRPLSWFPPWPTAPPREAPCYRLLARRLGVWRHERRWLGCRQVGRGRERPCATGSPLARLMSHHPSHRASHSST